jgi:hypothetical protein
MVHLFLISYSVNFYEPVNEKNCGKCWSNELNRLWPRLFIYKTIYIIIHPHLIWRYGICHQIYTASLNISKTITCFVLFSFSWLGETVHLVRRPLLAYCTSPGWSMMMIMEQSVERGLAGETEVLGENLPQCHVVHHKSHMTRPGIEPGPPRWEASD